MHGAPGPEKDQGLREKPSPRHEAGAAPWPMAQSEPVMAWTPTSSHTAEGCSATTPPFSPPWTQASPQTFLPSFPAATINTQRTKQEREWEVEHPPRRQGLGTPLVPSNRNDMPNALLPLTQMRRREGCGAAGRKEPRSLRDHRTQRAPHPRGPPPSKHSDGKNPTSSWRTDAGGQEGGRLKQGCVSAHRVRDYALEESTRKTLGKRQNYRDEK